MPYHGPVQSSAVLDVDVDQIQPILPGDSHHFPAAL